MAKILKVVTDNDGYKRSTQLPEEQVRKIAASLYSCLNIRPGTSLVMILGSGEEHSNQEAVATWTRATLSKTGLRPNREALHELSNLLSQALIEFEVDALHQ